MYVLGCDKNSISDVGHAEGPGEAVTDGTGPFPAVTVWPVHRGRNGVASPSWHGQSIVAWPEQHGQSIVAVTVWPVHRGVGAATQK